jgi:endonuclease/exonuclease/phosphatase family metal-dependent hydrolase
MSPPGPDSRPLRVVSYNLHRLAGDRAALRSVINALSPDVLVAQEGTPHLRWRVAAARLARECQLVYSAGGRDAGGTMILCSMRVEVTDTFVERYRVPRLVQSRGAVGIRARASGLDLAVFGTHLDLDESRRLDHTSELLATAESFAGATDSQLVVAADTNELPGAACWRRILSGGLVDAAGTDTTPTFPAKGARARIDAVFVPAGVRVVGYAVGDAALPPGTDPVMLRRASDHLPVVVDLLPMSAG